MGVPVMGSQAKLWVVEALPFNASTASALEFVSETLSAKKTLVYNDGIRGTRARGRERVRVGGITCNGTITMTPSKAELDLLLPWILGADATGAGTSGDPYVYALAETLQEFQVMVFRVSSVATHTAEVFVYEGCRVARATFSASSGGPLTLSLDIEAETEVFFENGSIGNGYGTAYPTQSTAIMSSGSSIPSSVVDNNSMFMFSDSSGASGNFEVGGAVRNAYDWTLTIDNMLDAGRQLNQLVRTSIPTMDRLVTLNMTLPFTSDEDDLYNVDVNDSSPDMNDCTFTFYAADVTNLPRVIFTLGTVNVDPVTPTVGSKGEVVLSLSGTSYRKNSSTAKPELQVSTAESS